MLPEPNIVIKVRFSASPTGLSRPLSGVKIYARKTLAEIRRPLGDENGVTDATGTCMFFLENGSWIIGNILPPDVNRLQLELPPRGNVRIGTDKEVSLTARPRLMGEHCRDLTQKLQAQLQNQEYEKARRGVRKLASLYEDYREIPEMVYYLALEDLLTKAETGQMIGGELAQLVIDPSIWETEEGSALSKKLENSESNGVFD